MNVLIVALLVMVIVSVALVLLAAGEPGQLDE
jgi:hypothetical protein